MTSHDGGGKDDPRACRLLPRRRRSGNGASGRMTRLLQSRHGHESAASARPAFAATIYLVAFVTGAIVMSFEMLGSRYLNPYFGSGIYTWASLISTVLAALCVGYFIGGVAADRYPSAAVLGVDRADRIGLHPGAAAVLRAADGIRARRDSIT